MLGGGCVWCGSGTGGSVSVWCGGGIVWRCRCTCEWGHSFSHCARADALHVRSLDLVWLLRAVLSSFIGLQFLRALPLQVPWVRTVVCALRVARATTRGRGSSALYLPLSSTSLPVPPACRWVVGRVALALLCCALPTPPPMARLHIDTPLTAARCTSLSPEGSANPHTLGRMGELPSTSSPESEAPVLVW